jgi:CDP-diacylglycerol--glycerol-3-phosphate 3-phosphatidyltransferase
MKLPNRITLFRLLIPLIFMPIVMAEFPGAKAIAFGLFILATFSDWLDGYIARKYDMTSDFGRLMDPLADKILVASALVSFVAIVPDIVKVWMVVVIISRDFLVTGLRLLAMRNNRILSADRIGKHKTGWQMGAILSILCYLAYFDVAFLFPQAVTSFMEIYIPLALLLFYYIIVGLTLVSGAFYLWKYRDLYNEHV